MTLPQLFVEEINNSPVPVVTAHAMLEALATFIGDLVDDDPTFDCPNSLTTRDCIEARAAVMQAVAVFNRRRTV